jgi:glycosyltransferase involved in cell wall biosynthesis
VRIALVPQDNATINSIYRSIAPLSVLTARGHQTRRLDTTQERGWDEALRWCDVLHIHRVCDARILSCVKTARAHGAATVWDDDDDVTRIPKRTEAYRNAGGLNGARRLAMRSRLFGAVDLVTTTNERLAGIFRDGGAPEVQVVDNYVWDEMLGNRAARAGISVGWVAGGEHALDLERIPVRAALQQLLEQHPRLHVTAIGVDLRLRSERYRHIPVVQFPQLLSALSSFDIGIAPLSPDLHINHMRSSIKLKEYAAVGVPWLASPIGPYAGMGEREGGRLVPDDRWYEELDALIRNDRARRKLAKRAAKWGKQQFLSANAAHWERAFAHAIERARAGVSAAAEPVARAGGR